MTSIINDNKIKRNRRENIHNKVLFLNNLVKCQMDIDNGYLKNKFNKKKLNKNNKIYSIGKTIKNKKYLNLLRIKHN
jgi:hypothetical protein